MNLLANFALSISFIWDTTNNVLVFYFHYANLLYTCIKIFLFYSKIMTEKENDSICVETRQSIRQVIEGVVRLIEVPRSKQIVSYI